MLSYRCKGGCKGKHGKEREVDIMTIVLLCIAVLAYGFIKEAIEQNQPYYGTDRDIFRNNPKAQENRKAVDEIIKKYNQK